MHDEIWRGPQKWIRDAEQPCLSLGAEGAFDDTHIFAPCVAFEDGRFRMWYCGSRGGVDERVFSLGLANSTDGMHFKRYPASPVFSCPDGTHSVLAPTLLRLPTGEVFRQGGKLRMWYSSCDFPSGDGLHTLHEIASADGVSWTPPSDAQLENAYAPTVIKEGDTYRMWYTDVEKEPWCIRHAESPDGCEWRVTRSPVLEIDQAWEHGRFFYPTVLRIGATYLMWYGSYSVHNEDVMKTALGFATSPDGFHWRKHAGNPVFGPDSGREWESHYTTSESILRLPDGSWRIWYASRSGPPFIHKYLAIGTAAWTGFKTTVT